MADKNGDEDMAERPFPYPLPRGETLLMITRYLGRKNTSKPYPQNPNPI
jgi:hypothetical protein